MCDRPSLVRQLSATVFTAQSYKVPLIINTKMNTDKVKVKSIRNETSVGAHTRTPYLGVRRRARPWVVWSWSGQRPRGRVEGRRSSPWGRGCVSPFLRPVRTSPGDDKRYSSRFTPNSPFLGWRRSFVGWARASEDSFRNNYKLSGWSSWEKSYC